MQLDSSRNHIIMVNLWLSMLNISVMASTILPAFFGMNLEGPISSTDGHNFFLVRRYLGLDFRLGGSEMTRRLLTKRIIEEQMQAFKH